MKRSLLAASLIGLLNACSGSGSASRPQALAEQVQAVLKSGDFKAAAALTDFDKAPAELRFALLDLVRECAAESECSTALKPVDDEYRASSAAQAEQVGADPVAAEGLIAVTMTSKSGSGSGTMEMPFAKIQNSYALIFLHPGAARIQADRARTNETLMHELLAAGIYDNASQSHRTDWETAATVLPPDGGDPGKAFVRGTAAMAAAVDAVDPDAAMRTGSRWATLVFADKDYSGNPIALDARKRKLQAQSVRMLRQVKVSGGYQLGDDAVLMVDAVNGAGWIERGAIIISRDGEAWDTSIAGKKTVSYPVQ